MWSSHAHESFLVPTWSLSIEWLFYMVAPFVIWGLARRRLLTAFIIALGLTGIYCLEDSLTAMNRSFHLGNAFHFLTGIASYFAWKHLPEKRDSKFWRIGFWLLIAIGFLTLHLPYKIWISTMAVILYGRFHNTALRSLECARRILLSTPLQFLGRISYVTYLIHWIVMELVVYGLIQFVPELLGSKYVTASVCVLLVFPSSYLLSDIVHRYVELPLMRIPKSSGQVRRELALGR